MDLTRTFLSRAALLLTTDTTLTMEQAVQRAYDEEQRLCGEVSRTITTYSASYDYADGAGVVIAGASARTPYAQAAIAYIGAKVYQEFTGTS